MKAPTDYLFVKTDKTHEDSVSVGGQELYLDPTYKATQHVRIYATVASVPEKLSPRCIYDYSGERPRVRAKYYDEVEVEVGDKVYFHFNSLIKSNRYEVDGEVLYMVDYRSLFCRVTESGIQMLNGRILVQPKMETLEDITRFGIQIKVEPEAIPLVGIVRHVGKAQKPDGCELSQGDEIYFAPDSEFTNHIEGEDYYVMYQKDVVGKYIQHTIINY